MLVSVNSCRLELGCNGAGLQWGVGSGGHAGVGSGLWGLHASRSTWCLVRASAESSSAPWAVRCCCRSPGGKQPPRARCCGSISRSVAALLVWHFNVPAACLIGMATATIVLQHCFEAPTSASLQAIAAGPTCEEGRGCWWLGAPVRVAPSRWHPTVGTCLALPRASAQLVPRAVPAAAPAAVARPGVTSPILSQGPMLLAASS